MELTNPQKFALMREANFHSINWAESNIPLMVAAGTNANLFYRNGM